MHLPNELPADFIQELQQITGLITDPEVLRILGSDETEDLCFPPQLAVSPENAEEVSRVLSVCNQFKVPVTVRGGGTGLSGGALPVHGGLVLETRKLNRILEIDTNNLQAVVEPGVINQELRDAVEAVGLFYPPDPSSKGSCYLGGNLAENAGGPRAVKYGVTRDYILGLEAVLANGEIIHTGAKTLKNSTGYNLTQLLIGSEGTLGVITKIYLKLVPKPHHDLLMLVPFNRLEDACAAVAEIFGAGITPSALEFMERDAIEWSANYLGEDIQLSPQTQAHLLIEVDGNYPDALMADCEKIAELLEQFDIGEILFADNSHQKDQLWKIRRNVAHAVKANSIYKEEDTVVPRHSLPELIRVVKSIGDEFGFKSVCYGHAGDGNLHINIVKGDLSEVAWNQTVVAGISKLFAEVKRMGGTISGEHGIGWVQKNYMHIQFSDAELALMKGIKSVFDPNGILNPSKIFPDHGR